MSPKFQQGYLLTWRGNVGDANGRTRVNLGVFQPFASYQLGNGWYTGGASIRTCNFQNDNCSITPGICLDSLITFIGDLIAAVRWRQYRFFPFAVGKSEINPAIGSYMGRSPKWPDSCRSKTSTLIP